MKATKEMVHQAQADQRSTVISNRLMLIQSIEELESIGGKDDYVESLRTILGAYPDGIRLSRVQEVMGNAKFLMEARETLNDKIVAIDGKWAVLKLRSAATTEATE